ncbi:hypothetical protein AALD01_08505 [Oscillospiraceae bacterium 21-37]
MYNFVEKSVCIPKSEFPMLHRHPGRLVVQAGLQPVAFLQEDVAVLERPQSLLQSLFASKKRG